MRCPRNLYLCLAVATALILVATDVVAAQAIPGCSGSTDKAEWSRYKQRFMSKQGRIIDTGNGGVSHSEGQGFGMRLAVYYGERDDFERIWQWTRHHLYVRDDELAAWRWRPDSDPHIDDKNNATDGDLFIAWSLALAGRCWDNQDYLQAARRIAQAIRSKLIKDTAAGHLLLPGAAGFVHGDVLTLNPSYWVFPAFAELERLEPDAPQWAALITEGQALMDQMRFGRWQLVPDWVQWSPEAGFSLPEQFAPRFGYDAIRVPLYLIWQADNAEILSRLSRYWEEQRDWAWQPDWIDLKTDAISSYGAPAGIRAVSELTGFAVASTTNGTAAFLSLPALTAEQQEGIDYYSSSLSLFARIAAQSWCRRHGCLAAQEPAPGR
ncbi:glycosyl hydrolase family 8 [Halochromatium glycolicum]|uniref:cellulase n=1 Tax=Halochromatium glycolicum TaxID=85075 RepID=A0AAJ0U7A8_9GAMM|nr:glycosyl hydrolase family 8 [Halochromatium glycolicum]MBK1706629.1 hypothetical protein [Halochromatium glycolicum]